MWPGNQEEGEFFNDDSYNNMSNFSNIGYFFSCSIPNPKKKRIANYLYSQTMGL